MEINEQVEKILAYGDCCDHCLGRFFGKRSHGLSNDERGRGLRIARALAENQPYERFTGTCWVCGNFFDAVPEWAKKVIAAMEGHRVLHLPCRVPGPAADRGERGDGLERSLACRARAVQIGSEPGSGKGGIGHYGKSRGLSKSPMSSPSLTRHQVRSKSRSTRSSFTGGTRSSSGASRRPTGTAGPAKGPAARSATSPASSILDSVEELIGRPVIETF